MAAATICPMKYETLKSEVKTGLSLGYASSPINEEPETMQVGIPKPRIMRATMYMPTVLPTSASSTRVQAGQSRLTMLRETLNEGAGDHNERSAKDGPPAAESVIDVWNQGERQNSAQGVGGGNNALEGTLWVVEV
jgi:hypothetical protein